MAPLRMESVESPAITGPVTVNEEAVMVSWPSFSTSVMLAIRVSIRLMNRLLGYRMAGPPPRSRPDRRSRRALSPAAIAALPDDALLEAVQRQTFRFFWEGGHPVSGLAADRRTHARSAGG